MTIKCPGSQIFSQPYPEEKRCPVCGYDVEIWSDETKTVCPQCKTTIRREMQMGCLSWCRYAKECVGGEVYNKYIANIEREEDKGKGS